jgi:hypothetical protein
MRHALARIAATALLAWIAAAPPRAAADASDDSPFAGKFSGVVLDGSIGFFDASITLQISKDGEIKSHGGEFLSIPGWRVRVWGQIPPDASAFELHYLVDSGDGFEDFGALAEYAELAGDTLYLYDQTFGVSVSVLTRD